MNTQNETHAEVMQDSDGGYWVYWSTATAHGARGAGMDKHAATELAARIRMGGPRA